jgi:hypothetical protein
MLELSYCASSGITDSHDVGVQACTAHLLLADLQTRMIIMKFVAVGPVHDKGCDSHICTTRDPTHALQKIIPYRRRKLLFTYKARCASQCSSAMKHVFEQQVPLLACKEDVLKRCRSRLDGLRRWLLKFCAVRGLVDDGGLRSALSRRVAWNGDTIEA